MYKYIGVSLMGLFLFMMFPSGMQNDTQEGLKMYGAATLDYQDESGNSLFTQTVHNQLFDAGEQEIMKQVFADGTSVTADNVQIAAMCISEDTPLTDETDDAAAFVLANSIAGGQTNCIEANFTINAGGTAVTPANVFTAGVNLVSGDTVDSIGICSGTGVNPHEACSGVLFAVVDTSDVTLSGSESVTITYTFDISSPSS